MSAKKRPTESEPAFRVSRKYLLAGVLSWLCPGAGHWMLGYRGRAVLIGGLLLGTFWYGETVLADNKAVTREVHPIFFGLQVGNGLSTLLAETIWGAPHHPEPENIRRLLADLPASLNLGILFCSVSGLLNVLVVLHILDPRTWKNAGERSVAKGAARSR